jgi:SAM-dependent methyltransferase
MGIWQYVQKYDFSSPEKQIDLLVYEAKKILSKKRNLKVLDIGGGFRDRRVFLKTLGSVIVLDRKKGPTIDIVGNAQNLPFTDNSFDVVALFMVLEHLEDPKVALGEIARVLKPKGVLLLTTVQYWHNHDCPKDYFRYTDDGLRYLCSKSGLKIRKIWSQGGPFLVIFHAIELNLSELPRKLVLLAAPIFNWLDSKLFNHSDKRKFSDSVGWSLVAQKAVNKNGSLRSHS